MLLGVAEDHAQQLAADIVAGLFALDDARDQGLAAGEVLILFLSGSCPAPSAVASGVHFTGTGVADSFRVTSDVPVVAYQINPYGGGSAAVTGASLLLPTSAWDTNYVLINGLAASIGQPAANVIAIEDATTITIDPAQ